MTCFMLKPTCRPWDKEVTYLLVQKNNIKHVTQHCGEAILHTSTNQGDPPLSLLALFPIDLYSLIKTNQGGILLVDSI